MIDMRISIVSKYIATTRPTPIEISVLIEKLVKELISESVAPYSDLEVLKESNANMHELITKIHEMTTIIPIG